ncbi:MAG: NAD+ synthase [Proteobacteria bacterium]|nr:NAD+ synthase [Pseudomonadota bacterium]
MKIAIAQLNSTIGDIDGNLAKIEQALSAAAPGKPDLAVFPELFLSGYPPTDLLEQPAFIEKLQAGINTLLNLSRRFPGMGVLCGSVIPTGKKTGRGLYNAALLMYEGRQIFRQCKSLLPAYDVFYETRYFDPGEDISVCAFKDEILGISICEDAWNVPEVLPPQTYSCDPLEILAEKGATLFINLSASPFYVGKEKLRHTLITSHAARHHAPFVFVNLVGGNDELIFDGRSMVIGNTGKLAAILPSFEEKVLIIDTENAASAVPYVPEESIETVSKGLILGIRDYLRKCGFSKALLGLSGGIDSAVTACLAAAAIGSENILGVTMPSVYSSTGSVEDSRILAHNLGINFKVIPISQVYAAYLDTLHEHFAGKQPDVTEENIQARIRGNLLMALSNKFGYLLLSTGNKSELAVGYCTLYGDMSGGLCVISDLPKTMVYALAQFINRGGEVIPQASIAKPPSAELRPDQCDQDTLPPYEILDRIVDLYLNERCSERDIIAKNFDADTVRWVLRAIDRNEYKRRQAPPGIKITNKAFGTGRRMPIAAKYIT